MTARKVYTIEDYRRALAKLNALRAGAAPGLTATLAAAVTVDAELAPVSMVVPAGGLARRATMVGLAPPAVVGDRWAATAAVLRELTIEAAPVTPAVLRAVGLAPRPNGRER